MLLHTQLALCSCTSENNDKTAEEPKLYVEIRLWYTLNSSTKLSFLSGSSSHLSASSTPSLQPSPCQDIYKIICKRYMHKCTDGKYTGWMDINCKRTCRKCWTTNSISILVLDIVYFIPNFFYSILFLPTYSVYIHYTWFVALL